MSCPCGGEQYETCCGPRHDGSRPAETAEALMRSRYSAFAKGLAKYLVDTRTGERRFGEAAELERWSKSVTWLGLEVKASSEDTVHFVARYLEDQHLVSMEEESRFAREGGRWLYVEGEPKETREKLERNAPCPCGSGKKFKQCHA